MAELTICWPQSLDSLELLSMICAVVNRISNKQPQTKPYSLFESNCCLSCIFFFLATDLLCPVSPLGKGIIFFSLAVTPSVFGIDPSPSGHPRSLVGQVPLPFPFMTLMYPMTRGISILTGDCYWETYCFQLLILHKFQVNSKGTQSYMYTCIHS